MPVSMPNFASSIEILAETGQNLKSSSKSSCSRFFRERSATLCAVSNTHSMNADGAAIRHRITDLDDEGDYPDEYQLMGEEPVQMEKGFSKIIVVDNLPVVPTEKYSKLLGV